MVKICIKINYIRFPRTLYGWSDTTYPERILDHCNRANSRSRYPYISTFRGAPRPRFGARAPQTALAPVVASSSRRAGHKQIFLPHERPPFESAPASRQFSNVCNFVNSQYFFKRIVFFFDSKNKYFVDFENL